MSSLWTPSGEHQPAGGPPPGTGGDGSPPSGPPGPPGDDPSPEEIEALREVHARLMATPVEDVIANHALGLWQVALVHLGGERVGDVHRVLHGLGVRLGAVGDQ